MSTSMFLVVILCMGITAFVVFNRPSLMRLWATLRGQGTKASRALWGADPMALKQAEIDSKAEQVAEATNSLSNCKALKLAASRQVESLTKESNRLGGLAAQFVREGDDDTAREKLLEKTAVDAQLADAKESFTQHEETYQVFLKKIQAANKRINDLRQSARQQGVRLQMAKAEANLATLGDIMGKPLSFDSLNEVDEEIEAQIDQNRAKAQVFHDLAQSTMKEIEAEERMRKSQADDALSALKQQLGK